ncbi:TonB-dependent receptor domain-containing protein [Silvibacterium acidisoli]|uniref:TonB-dependent receptor domain-containing protein n=1 Tax=Acidobacteriaceae bacterium ZG23-2 TaxID=2883246 RepID=UPI00406C1870
MLRLVYRSLVLVPLLYVSSMVAASAQATSVSGVIRDPGQLVVPDASVMLDGAAGHLETTTDGSGHYAITLSAAGRYVLTAKKNGFDSATMNLTVRPGVNTSADLSFLRVNTSTSVTVQGVSTGTAATGYFVGAVDRGVMGSAPVADQPFTITLLPADQIANTQVKNLRDALKYLPLVQFTEQQGPEILRPATRGMQGSIAQNTRMDGMAMAITGGNPMEQYQTLQVENGLGASMYGPANPSGMFDFVLKRPTDDRFANLYLEQDSSTVGTAWLDAGGRVGPHKIFGYRTNLLYGDGAQFVDGSELRRRLAMFAFDVRATDRTTIDGHYSAYDIVQRGYPGWFTYGENTAVKGSTQDPSPDFILPSAPDPTVRGFGQSYAGVNLTTQTGSVRLLHDFSPNWHAAAGGLAQRLDRFIDTQVNVLTSNAGDYKASLATGFAPRFGVESDLGYITGTYDKWGLRQDIVVASEGYRFNQYGYTAPVAANVLLGTANVDAPKIFAPPAAGLPKNVNIYQSAVVHQQGFNLGDMIWLPKKFVLRLAASQDWIGADNYTLNTKTLVPAWSSGSNKNGISPSASLMYKPKSWMTAYATFASSLQQGDIAPSSANVVNAGQSLAPYRSKEWELGFKTDAHPIAFTADLYRLQRPFANTVSYNGSTTENIFRIVGNQVNYGAELQAQGTLFHRLLIDGGFTAINARLNDTQIAATDGKRFVGIPEYRSGLYSEYLVPGVDHLSITGAWEFIGVRPQDDENLHTTAGSNEFDLGFRYAHPLFRKMATLRLNCQNIGDAHYYSTIAAGDITGTNASSNVAHMASPRTLSTSLEFSF